MSSPQWLFADFRLDPDNACLWHGTQAVALTPKAFDVLYYLVTHPDRLVPKDTLLEAVWPATAVSDVVVRVAIGELRKALGDTAQAPRFIATVFRRGYRFIAPVTQVVPGDVDRPARAAPPLTPDASPLVSSVARRPLSATPPLIGREAVLTRLHAALELVRQGQRQVLLLTGEPGIGKTAVVEAFAAQVSTAPPVCLAFGQCVEHYGPGEPYLPILEALGQLCRGPTGARLSTLLRQQAPTWLVQMPWLLGAADRAHLQQELHGATRERMLRELAEVIETLATEVVLILVLEDLHWSDYATLDALALLAQRRESTRLLLLGTYRPVEVTVRGHPLQTVIAALRVHGQCTEVPLELLSATGVAQYLAVRFPQHHFSAALAQAIHQRTEGNPLFVVQAVEYMVAQGVLSLEVGKWVFRGTLDEIDVVLPENIRQMLTQQFARLSMETQQMLEVASVAGMEFSAAAIAAGLETDVVTVETRCEGLARQQHWLRAIDCDVWPDGTVAGHYAFLHALYHSVVSQRVTAARHLHLHRRIGEAKEAAYGPRASEIAAELAVHFTHGRDYHRAVQYLQQAGDNAMRRWAYQEAIAFLTRGLEFLETQPETPARVQQELDLQLALGPALMAARGWAVPEAEQTYARARMLCAQVQKTPQLFPTLQGLWRFYRSRGDLSTALKLGEELYRLAQREAAPTYLLEAHDALGQTWFYLGEYATAWQHFVQGIPLIAPAVQRSQAFHQGIAPGVACLAYAAPTLWSLGYPEQALQRCQEALRLTQELEHPQSQVLVHHLTAYLYHRRREPSAVQAHSEAVLALATAQGWPLYVGLANHLRGWVLAMQGQSEEGMAQMRQGLAGILTTGQALAQPFCLVCMAEAAGYTGHVDQGLHLLAEALAGFEASGRRDMLAETYRLQGEFLLRQAVPDAVKAEAYFQQAVAIARQQHAKSWELRAALSLARLWQHQGKRAAAGALLADIHGWFTEGFDTADLQEAKTLLKELM
jgi:DNA-binding winged helix-turn-helix (wHTH) protein/predicted ATPase